MGFPVSGIPPAVAREIGQVGILPCIKLLDVGAVVWLGGYPFLVTGHTTKDRLIERMAEEGIDPEGFSENFGPEYYYHTVSTD